MSAVVSPPVAPPPAARTATAPHHRPARRSYPRSWPTPQLLRTFLVLAWLGTLLLFLAALTAVAQLHNAVQAVGYDSAPSIIAARQLRTALTDMDGNAARDLASPAEGSRIARDGFVAERGLIGRRLIDASEHITHGNQDRIPIETISDNLGAYTTLIEQARALHRQNPTDPNVLAIYRQATTLLHDTMLPATDDLARVNTASLNQAYDDYRRSLTILAALIFLAGGLLVALLVGMQIFLTRHTRRLVNVPLAAATVLIVIFVARLGSTITTEANTLKIAKHDAFDSIGTLYLARATVFDATADQGLYLLDSANAARYESDFRAKMAQVVSVPITDQLIASATSGDVRFAGYLGDELRNITFPGERDAAIDALRADQQYLAVDQRIRQLETSSQHPQAVALTIGTQLDQASSALDHFDTALTRALNINKAAFDRAIDRGFSDLAPYRLLTPAVALVIAFLAWLGLQSRLREYAV